MSGSIRTDVGVVAAGGFRATGIASGIKDSAALDLTLLVNDGPGTAAAGVFTTNQVKAAPVLWSTQVLQTGKTRAVVLNSGCANACTGPEGFQDTHATAEKVADALGYGAIDIAVCSTGLIGERLPLKSVLSGVDIAVARLGSTPKAGLDAATGVLTTDSEPKQAALHDDAGWAIGGFAKGAGMCAPNMATMLSVLTTDAVIDAERLDAALRLAVAPTFNSLNVDGGTSTNDTVLILASGHSGVVPDADSFAVALTNVCASLTTQLQRDAEGASKQVSITVQGVHGTLNARLVANVVAEDNLVKTALFGSDPNWGRIAMAVGRSGYEFEQENLDILINDIAVCRAGLRAADRSIVDISGKYIDIVIDLNSGTDRATVFTTDLSHDYVDENSAYSS